MSKVTFGCLCKLLELLLFSFINDFIILFILLTILQKRSVNTESGQSVNFACHKYTYVMLWKKRIRLHFCFLTSSFTLLGALRQRCFNSGGLELFEVLYGNGEAQK